VELVQPTEPFQAGASSFGHRFHQAASEDKVHHREEKQISEVKVFLWYKDGPPKRGFNVGPSAKQCHSAKNVTLTDCSSGLKKKIIHQFETMPFAARYFAAGYFENCSPGIV